MLLLLLDSLHDSVPNCLAFLPAVDACAAQALAEKGVMYSSKYTDLFNGQSLSPEYLAVNPKGTVPALVIQQGADKRIIADSR
jgi:glutathione S-transferase